jgi:hypothetical protein
MHDGEVRWAQIEHDLESQGNVCGLHPEGNENHCCFINRRQAKSQQFLTKINFFLKYSTEAGERRKHTVARSTGSASSLLGF